MSLLRRIFGPGKHRTSSDASGKGLRPVKGAASFTHDGEVIYNLLTPHMQQFMGRCIGAVKKAGIRARGTGQLSILLGEEELELSLEPFYQPSDDPSLVERVVEKARDLTGA
jgi:hypothetical protein